MKRKSFYFFLLTLSFFVPTIAVPSWAKNCPEIPTDIKEITVKSNVATLRTEVDKGSEKGFNIAADDKLKVLDHKSTVDKSGQEFCWYQVSAVKDTDNKPYFIADVGIKEFPFTSDFSSSLPLPEDSSVKTKTKIQFQSIISWRLWLAITLGWIGALGNIGTLIFCIRRFSKQEEFLEQFKTLKLDSLDKITNKVLLTVSVQGGSTFIKILKTFV